MILYRMELKKDGGDYGSSFHEFVAENDREAWKKALKIEDAEDIKKIYPVKFIG